MTGFTTYHSAVRVLCHVLEIEQSEEAATEYWEQLKDSGTADGGCDAVLLAQLCRGAGLETLSMSIPPCQVECVVAEALHRLRGSFIQVRSESGTHAVRWALVFGGSRSEVLFSVACAYDEAFEIGSTLDQFCTGDVVVLRQRAKYPAVMVQTRLRGNEGNN